MNWYSIDTQSIKTLYKGISQCYFNVTNFSSNKTHRFAKIRVLAVTNFSDFQGFVCEHLPCTQRFEVQILAIVSLLVKFTKIVPVKN